MIQLIRVPIPKLSLDATVLEGSEDVLAVRVSSTFLA